MADAGNEVSGRKRRTPVQKRSRDRVQEILTATGELLGEGGVEAVTTRALAERAGMSVAGIYQYFPNSDSIIDAYLERASSQIDSDVIAAVSQLEVVTIRRVLEAAVITHVRFYERNSELVEIWLSATSDSIVLSRARERNEALGHMLRDAFLAADFLGPAMPEYGTDLVVEVCASAIEFAFRTKRPAAEREDIAQLGINMVIPAIEGFMTPRGLKGISAQEFIDALTQSAVAVTTRPRRD